ncbi:lysine--tRNA ligase [Candidatus Parcubacteria bacterium]|nr:MAG: lysine--tRNA ligase [Candidatus Parcubacteria bacterium]
MASIEELRRMRIEKLESLKKAGVNPYPARTSRTHNIREVIEGFDKFENAKTNLVLAGRIIGRREHGSLLFLDLQGGDSKLQLHCQEEKLGKEKFKQLQEFIDIGDFIEAHGSALTTKRGEKSLDVSDYKVLVKTIRPVPTTWYGLKDFEERMRRRYLDLLLNPETKELFRKKNIFWQTVRNFLTKEGFLEVETPVFEDIPGGADAEPFSTRYNALNRDFYLRISLELPLKKLIVGGYEKVFEIGRIFRNEGIDAEHLQEYTQMEFYWSYADYNNAMELTEKLYKELAQKILGRGESEYDGKKIQWGEKWPRIDYFDVFKKETSLDLNKASKEDLLKKAQSLKIEADKELGWGRLADLIFKKTVRPKMIQPCFIIHHPVEVSPLSKRRSENPKQVERFQIMAGGSEIGNGFSELNDPIDQRIRFEEQMKLREAGDKEAQILDEAFIEALEYGMPPTAGFGMSERVFSVLMDKSIRETTIFPYFKEKND